MLRHEPFSGGLVNSADPDVLEIGELQGGNDFWYVSNSDNLVQGPALATATLNNSLLTYGLVPTLFDNGNAFLVNGTETEYQYWTINGTSGALSASATALTYDLSANRKSLVAVHCNNKYYLLDGVQTNQVFLSDGTVRRHGLKPVITALATPVTGTAASGSWPAQATGYFDYWYTEVMKLEGTPEDIIIESSYEATTTDSNTSNPAGVGINVSGPNGEAIKMMVADVFVGDLNTKVTLTMPAAPENSEATHYRIYRSNAKDASTDLAFPTGYLIAEVGTATTSVVDGQLSTSGYVYPSIIVSSTSWTNPANAIDGSLHFSDSTYATAPGASVTLTVRGFNASSQITNEPISGLNVEVRGKISTAPGEVKAQVSFDGGVSWSSYVTVGTLGTSDSTITTGMRSWGRTSITLDDLLDTNFYVRIKVTGVGTFSIDGIRVSGQFNGSDVGIVPYPSIVLSEGSLDFSTSRNGEPPIAKTGCIFQGSLVTDDHGAPSNVRWSMAGDPEAFPTLYYIPIETKNNDQVTFIGTVNGICVVGLNNAIVRLNYLPTEADASFTRTRVYDYITSSIGILHPKAAVTFLTPTGHELLACITQDGLYVTDGYSISKWDSDYLFAETILDVITAAGNSIYDPRFLQITNDVSSGNLLVTYVKGSGDFRIVPFAYSRRHLKGDKFKVGLEWTGSAAEQGVAVTGFNSQSGVPLVYIARNTGDASCITTLSSLGSLTYTPMTATAPTVVSRTLTLSDAFEEATVDGIYIQCSGADASTISVTITTRFLDTAATEASNSVSFIEGRVSKADITFNGYQSCATFTVSGNALHKLNRFSLDVTKFGG